jgi:AcrR family transcriptional regulator
MAERGRAGRDREAAERESGTGGRDRGTAGRERGPAARDRGRAERDRGTPGRVRVLADAPRRIPADERRALILREAGRLFARHGYAGTRLDDVAAAAHVTKPMVYRHFESKKALYMSLLEKHRDDLPTHLEQADGVRPILENWFDYVRENQHAWLMLFRDSSGDDDIRTLRRAVSLRAREVLAGFIAEQPGSRIPAEEVEPTAEVLTSGLAGLVLWWIDHPKVPKSVLVDVAARIIAGAVAGGPDGGSENMADHG